MANIYTYPNDFYKDGTPETADTNKTPYMIISAYPYNFQLQKTGNNDNKKNIQKDYKFHFITYIPKDVGYENAPGYANKQALAVAGTANNMNKDTFDKVVTETALLAGDKLLATYIGGLTKELGMGNLYQTAKDQVSIGTGLWMDPRQVDVFQSPAFLNQSFDFTLLANSLKEADDIKMITTLFKYSALPSRTSDSPFGEMIPILKAPMNFDLTIVTPTEDAPTKTLSLMYEYYYLNLKSVAIKPIITDNREDIAFYSDGNAIGYTMKLQFSSMHPSIKPSTSTIGIEDGGTIKKALRILEGGGDTTTTTQKQVITDIQ